MLKGGVLLIGSLLWDKSGIRTNWRAEHLKLSDSTIVDAPIRYGRISESRDNTYTMVFSAECLSKSKTGKAIFIPFVIKDMSFEQIVSQAKLMISAEHNKEKELNRLNWGWGSIGIMINPRLKGKDETSGFLKKWSENYSKGFNPMQYKVGIEDPIISKNGILTLKWDDRINEYDFLIATVTKPNVEAYPSISDMANAIIDNNHFDYFENNVKNGVKTYQDEDLQLVLENKKNVK